MIIKALVDYYEALSESNEEITKPGYSSTGVSYGLCLNEDGDIVSVKTLMVEETDGKKTWTKPKFMAVPLQEETTSNIKASFLCNKSSYMLGLNEKEKPQKSMKCFNAAKELHKKILSEVDDPAAKAVCNFFDKWSIEKANENVVLKPYLKDIIKSKSTKIAFMINDIEFVHERPKIKEAWEQYYFKPKNIDKRLCLVTGEYCIPARVHRRIKGVKISDKDKNDKSLICFNVPASESYGNSDAQGLNAPVSEYVAYAYVTALNRLISDRKHRQLIGDTTVVYWAENADTKIQDFFNDTAFNDGSSEDSEKLLSSIMESISSGRLPNMEGVDFNTNFYILGLAPNASRLSVRFFLKDTFGSFIINIAKHYKRLEIVKPSYEKKYLTPKSLLKQTVLSKPKDKSETSEKAEQKKEQKSKKAKAQSASPLLGGAFMRAVLSNYPYPALLYNSVLIRIKAERNINPSKAAIVKACLIKNYNLKEEATLALNENCKDNAYVLGRLFAVLEKIQKDARKSQDSKRETNSEEDNKKRTTIKEKYFTSACSTPMTVFPSLLRLSNYHLVNNEYKNRWESIIGELMDKLESESLPNRLTLKEQGLFILGYYHQVQNFYEKK